jgi:hypothetical protein
MFLDAVNAVTFGYNMYIPEELGSFQGCDWLAGLM